MLADSCVAEIHSRVAVMPFILGILAVLGAIVIFVIRANQAAQAARELGEVASEAKGFLRRRRWKSKTITDQIRAVEDPRLAAAVMMCALASSDGDLSESEVTAIQDQLMGALELAQDDCAETLAQARWLTRDMKDLGTVLHRAAAPIKAICTVQEKTELLEMLTAVAEVDGPMDAIQQDALDRLHRELDLNQR